MDIFNYLGSCSAFIHIVKYIVSHSKGELWSYESKGMDKCSYILFKGLWETDALVCISSETMYISSTYAYSAAYDTKQQVFLPE